MAIQTRRNSRKIFQTRRSKKSEEEFVVCTTKDYECSVILDYAHARFVIKDFFKKTHYVRILY